MSDNADDEFHKAIISKDRRALRIFFDKDSINKPSYDDEYTVDLLIKNKWILTDVVAAGKLELTKLFFERAGDSISVNDADEYGWTGLHRAACDSDIDQVKLFLLEYKADPNSLDEDFHTPLHCPYFESCEEDIDHCETLEVMKLLINEGAKAIVTRDGISYLQIKTALEDGNLEVVDFVLNLDIDLRAHYGESGNTALHYLARNSHSNALKIICGRDFDVNARNNRQETPLHVAAEMCNVQAVQFLLSEGADVNVVDAGNCTPVWIATANYEDYFDSSMKCIQLFLEYGADVQLGTPRSVSSNTIFDTILKFEDQEDKSKLYRLMLEYLALQEASGVKIIEIIRNKIDLLKEYFDNCKELLLIEIHESKTLLEVMCCSDEKLMTYMRNVDFICIMNHCCVKLKSSMPYYASLLQKRFDKATRTAALRNSSAIVICKLMKINYSGYSFIVDSILRYLKDEDLETLLSISL